MATWQLPQVRTSSPFFYSILPGPTTLPPRLAPRRGFSQRCLSVASSKRNGDRNGRDKEQQGAPLPLPSSFSFKRISGQMLIIIGILGFLDAGYSGDWSRIGVISQETESILRLAAYGVVPLSLYLLWLISNPSNQESG